MYKEILTKIFLMLQTQTLKFFFQKCYLNCILLFFIQALSLSANAKIIYLSASSGNDSYSFLQVQNINSPWKTLSKLNSNSNSLVYGDIVLLKRGDTFYGTLLPTVSGVTFGAYGTGNNPIITGLTTINSFTKISSNIWEAYVPGGLASLNVVVINGILTPMGRYPNKNTTNGGYLTYESFTDNTSITDNQLSSTPNFTGGEVVFRRSDYTSDRVKITNHSGNKLSFTTYAGASLNAGFGYFIQNLPSTLDQDGEWFYDPATKKIKIYYTSTPPSIQVATLPNVLNLIFTNNPLKTNITIRDIDFKGCEENLMNIIYCNNLTISNCNFSYAGINAIEFKYTKNLLIRGCTINDINMIGIHENNSTLNNYVTIQNNTLKRIGINAGMINNNYGSGSSSIGINVWSSNLLIKENVLDSIGYIGISVTSNTNQTIRKNVITNFCFVKNDGGAIYSRRSSDIIYTGIIIDSNIISKSIGAMDGSRSAVNQHARGIYLDSKSYGVSVLNNTLFDVWDGIYISQGQNNIIRGNTIFNVGNYNPKANIYSGAMVLNDAFDGYPHLRNNTITKNIFFAKYPNQLMWFQTDRYNGVNLIGRVDSNYYINPGCDLPLLLTNTTSSSLLTLYSIPQWKEAFTNYDVQSKATPKKIPQYIVNSLGTNKFVNGTYTSNLAGTIAASSPSVHSFYWDNTNQLSSGGSAKLTSSITSNNFTDFSALVGAIDGSKKYILRFKTKASKPGSFKTYLQQWTGAYDILTSSLIGAISNGIEQHEIIFSGEHTSQPSAKIYIQFSQNSSTIYIDDVQFAEAVITPTNMNDYIRFDYNKTNYPINIALNSNYMGVDGTIFTLGNYTLQPFSSKILMKEVSGITSLASIANQEIVNVAKELKADKTEDLLKINCYPNPTNAAFSITVSGGTNEKIKIIAMSSDGRIVYENVGNTNQNYIFGSSFLPGTYVVKVIQGTKVEILKVIKI